MKKFLAFIVLSNLIAVACVYLFEFSFGYLRIAFLKDYAFYSMLILLVLGAFFFPSLDMVLVTTIQVMLRELQRVA
ncbi:TPA: hypothetical protein ACGG78_003584 [Vibrio cholerae]|nr:hypothetical protein [Vibrio cholerae]